ncbi:hypothetical protein [Streptomyces lavendofoliae]|uniref:Uncharacterized protein n=1 Tax=Streptomyces lavendofoliae TaxID=67314 RepID=A0A918M7W4_9ACTN|nr:hypothetical protein [Streptomyces lavendofoliae]GGU63226.1 hypothetical protein GCM10010274_59930 [Streptomyces lavendofoliae]
MHGGETFVRLSVQGRNDTAVVLEVLGVRVVGRTAPAGGSAYAMDQGCGGSLTPRYFAADLDKDRPIARAAAGNDSGTPIPAVRMPYRVSAQPRSCGCRWYRSWTGPPRAARALCASTTTAARSAPAPSGLPRYAYDPRECRWGPYG